MVTMTGQNLPGWIYDPSAGSSGESAMTGGAAVGTFVATAGGLGSTTGLLGMQPNAAGGYDRVINGRVAATTGLTVLAAAASGAAAFSQIAGPGGAVAGTALGMLSTGLTGALTAHDAQKCKAALLAVQENLRGIVARQGIPGPDDDLVVVARTLNYCLGQQAVKFNKGVANATIVGQPAKVMYNAGRAAYKFQQGTKGVARHEYSRKIVEIAKKNTEAARLARDLIAAVVAKDYDSILANAVADAMKTG